MGDADGARCCCPHLFAAPVPKLITCARISFLNIRSLGGKSYRITENGGVIPTNPDGARIRAADLEGGAAPPQDSSARRNFRRAKANRFKDEIAMPRPGAQNSIVCRR